MNNKRWFILMAFSMFTILVLSACSSAASEQSSELAEEDEHTEGEHMDTPKEYADLTNPYAADHEAAEAGALLYEVNCATCHGVEGQGDGPAAEGLDPKPANLADAHMMEDMSDGALFWRVSEGGAFEPFNSTMPAWKGTLSEDEIWQLVTSIREFAEDDHD